MVRLSGFLQPTELEWKKMWFKFWSFESTSKVATVKPMAGPRISYLHGNAACPQTQKHPGYKPNDNTPAINSQVYETGSFFPIEKESSWKLGLISWMSRVSSAGTMMQAKLMFLKSPALVTLQRDLLPIGCTLVPRIFPGQKRNSTGQDLAGRG